MALDVIFQRISSSRSKHWRLEGFDTDVSPVIWICPILPGRDFPPPLQLGCSLNPESSYAKTLITAADYHNSIVGEGEIEQIATDIIQRLDDWSQHVNLWNILRTTTLGSVFRRDPIENGKPGIWLAPNYELRRRYLPVSRLRELWKMYSFELPPTLDIEELQSVARLHDSFALVKLPTGDLAIFKGAVRVVARMYHEIRELLRMPPHPNIITKLWYPITRRVSGLREPALCGFVLEYHSGGFLLNRISNFSLNKSTIMTTKIKWIRQIISAFRHLHLLVDGFYSERRLENIVLDRDDNIMLVDFEQYWSSNRWLPPPLW